jgi:hypothetical protein
LYIDDIIDALPDKSRASVIIYADDILLLSLSVSLLQRLLSICETELERIGMTINAKKSCCIRVGKRYDIKCTSIVTNNGACLPWVTSIRYLGITIVQ